MNIALHSGQRIRCFGCEEGCCVRFEIPVTQQEAEELLRLDLPGIPGNFDVCFEATERGEWRIRKDGTGRCIFADGRRCKIHALRGYAAKPLSCRIFPLHIQKWEDGAFSAELRYICPAAGSSGGRRLGEMLPEIATLARQLGDRRGVNSCVYSGRNPAPLASVRKVHAGFQAILHDDAVPLRLRLYTAARILDFHSKPAMHEAIRQADGSFAAEAAAFAQKARPQLETELGKGSFDAQLRSQYRSLFCGYLRDDAPEDTSLRCRLTRAYIHIRVFSGIGRLSELNPAAPELPILHFPKLGAALPAEPEAAAFFRDYFRGKLDSMDFCGSQIHRYSYEEGMRHLLLMPTVVFPLAAAFSLASGNDRISAGAMQRAVQLADFTFARSPFFRLKLARNWMRTLAGPKRFAGLVSHAVPPETF